jgi:tRNA (guanine37-N1)-methyltransferase
MRIDVVTIFPELFEPFLRTSFVAVARRKGALRIEVHDLRDWTTDRHRSVDDAPYGGGPGMVMKPEPLIAAIEALAGQKGPGRAARVILLSPQGEPLRQPRLEGLAGEEHLVLVCGRYEGVDQRAIDLAVDAEISIGDYVLSGGELPAMVLVEGLVRLLPGVLGNPDSALSESFGTVPRPGGGGAAHRELVRREGEAPGSELRTVLEGPQYTRPPVVRGLAVPAVLRSGDHAAIARWRAEQAREITRRRRPDLLEPSQRKDER